MNNWTKKVTKLLRSKYGIGVDDCCDEQMMQSAFTEGMTPADFVDYVGRKYDLDEISLATWWWTTS